MVVHAWHILVFVCAKYHNEIRCLNTVANCKLCFAFCGKKIINGNRSDQLLWRTFIRQNGYRSE